MIKNQNIVMWLITVSLLLIMAGTIMPLLRVEGDVWKYIYGSGAALLLYGRISAKTPKGASLRLRRFAAWRRGVPYFSVRLHSSCSTRSPDRWTGLHSRLPEVPYRCTHP